MIRNDMLVSDAVAPASADLETPLALMGGSAPARGARAALAEACRHRGAVLLTGEHGCRLEEVARALHNRARGAHPFLAVDCGTSDAAALDRRLFGEVPSRECGEELETVGGEAAILQGGAGTLFLDNIDGLPASAQRRLARVLRDGEVRVAGAPAVLDASFRLVAATTRDLETEAAEGRFRPDLLRRFASRVTVPPLRQRSQDVQEIVERLARDAGGYAPSFTSSATNVLAALPWTRNIDELATVVARILHASPEVVQQEDVLLNLPMAGGFARPDLTASLREARRRFEREYIAAVLERHQWRMSDAARTLGIERANLYRKTRQLGLTPRTTGASRGIA